MDTLSTIALTWRVERRDGVAIGLTSHDRDLEIDGFVYRAAPGMTPSAVRRSADLDADTMDVSGALSGAAIAERDLLGGRWDGARVVVRAVDWSDGSTVAELGEGRSARSNCATTPLPPSWRGSRACSTGRCPNRLRPNAGPNSATAVAVWRWRGGGGSFGWRRSTRPC